MVDCRNHNDLLHHNIVSGRPSKFHCSGCCLVSVILRVLSVGDGEERLGSV